MSNEELQQQGNQALARPDFIPVSREGTEHITRTDLKVPRIMLAQALSPELIDSDPKYIPGLKNGDMFNDTSKEVLGRGPHDIIVVRADPPRWVEFFPREAGGGVKDLNVPFGDKRTQFTRGPNGESIKPLATQFYDFIIIRYPFTRENLMERMAALSFKSSGLPHAREFNSQIIGRQAPIFAGKYTLRSINEKNAKGTYAVFVTANNGWITDPEMYAIAEETFKSLKDTKVAISREPGDEIEFPDVPAEAQPSHNM